MNEETFIARNQCLKNKNENKTFMKTIKEYIEYKITFWNWEFIPYRWRMFYYDYIKTFFKPCHNRIRKSIPKQWRDVSHLMVDINFEMIKVFYEDEYKADIVDWEATEHHKEFAEWLEYAYKYITKLRPQLEKDLENAYPSMPSFDNLFKESTDESGRRVFQMVDDGIPYEVKYKEVNRIEKQIEDTDTEILMGFVKRRNYFWT